LIFTYIGETTGTLAIKNGTQLWEGVKTASKAYQVTGRSVVLEGIDDHFSVVDGHEVGIHLVLRRDSARFVMDAQYLRCRN